MNRDDIIKLTLSRLGNRENDVRLQGIAVLELQNLQRDKLEGAEFKPWFTLSELEYTDTTIGDQRVALPNGFLEEYEEGSLLYRPDVTQPWTPLSKEELDYSQEWRYLVGVGPGIARVYSVVGNYFFLQVPPVVSYQLAMRYYKAQPVGAEAYGTVQVLPENRWMKYAPEWMISELGFLFASMHVRDADAAAVFDKQRVEAKARLYTQHIARMEANLSRVMEG